MIARLRGSELLRHSAIVFAGVVVANIFNYLYYVLIGRRADIETYGVVTSLASALLVVAAPAIVVQLIAARFASDLEARNDRAAIRALADVVIRWTAGVAGVLVFIAILARGALANFFNLTSSFPIVVVAVAFGLFAVAAAQRGILQGTHRFREFSISMAVDAVVRVLVGVSLVAKFGASGALFGLVVSLGCAVAYSQYAIHARFGGTRGALALDRISILRVISHVGLGQLTFTVLMFYDVPLIKHAFDARSAGLYAAAALVGRAVIAAISFIPTILMPKATARVAMGQSPFALIFAGLGMSGAVVLVAAVASGIDPHLVVTLIAGKSFGEAAPLVLAYVIASGMLAMANVVAAYKMGLHRYDFVVPAIVVATTEIGTLTFWHPSLAAAITVLTVGHAGMFAITLFRLNAPVSEGLASAAGD